MGWWKFKGSRRVHWTLQNTQHQIGIISGFKQRYFNAITSTFFKGKNTMTKGNECLVKYSTKIKKLFLFIFLVVMPLTDMIKNPFLKIHFWYKFWDIKSYRKSPKRDQMLNKMRNVQLFKISNANENMWTFQNAYQDHLRDSDNLSSNGLSRGEH